MKSGEKISSVTVGLFTWLGTGGSREPSSAAQLSVHSVVTGDLRLAGVGSGTGHSSLCCPLQFAQ